MSTMDDQEIFKEDKMEGEKTTDYIIPFKANSIRDKINLKVVGVIWTLLFLLKIICQDVEWGFFLMFTFC